MQSAARTAALIGYDCHSRDEASASTQQAKEILRRVLRINRFWLEVLDWMGNMVGHEVITYEDAAQNASGLRFN